MAIDFQPFDPHEPMKVYRRNLPRWRQDGATYFVTARLHDSLPQHIVQHLEILRRALAQGDAAQAGSLRHGDSDVARPARSRPESLLDADRKYFMKMKHYLDQGHGACWLRLPEMARAVRETVSQFEHERYECGELAILPNHFHVLVRPLAGCEMEKILHTWKSFTAKVVNKRVGRSGPVWQHESYDRLVRDMTEFKRTERYIRNNLLPVGQRDSGW